MAGKHRTQKSKKAPKAGKKDSSPFGRQSNRVDHLDQRHLATLHPAFGAGSGSPSPQNGFSMLQQARNTERHTSGWPSAPLRGNPISFVSAGHLVRDEPPSSGQEDQDQESGGQGAGLDAPLAPPEDAPGTSIDVVPDAPGHAAEQQSQEAPETSQDRGQSLDSDSEEDMILFRGRFKQASEPVSSTTTLPSHSARSTPQQSLSCSSSRKASQNPSPRPRKSRLNQILYVSDEEEALVQDYIANMAAEDVEDDGEDDGDGDLDGETPGRTKTFRFHSGVGDENAKVQTKSSLVDSAIPRQVDEAAEWDSSDLDDFDELATTDEEMDEIGQVLRHRVRPSGAQYLVTPTAKGADDAKWILHSKLTSSNAAAKIRTYHEVIKARMEEGAHSSSDGEDDDLDDIIDDIESEDAENAAIIARTARMTDEQIARALAKQEELGFGLDQLVLFDGQEGAEDDDLSDGFGYNSHPVVPFSVTGAISGRTPRGKRNRRRREDFPSAEAFADALDEDPYGGFDVMDFDRPSVRPKRKGKKNDFAFDFDLSDEDLSLQIKSQWQKDRDKKASRKREKLEQLEAQLIEAEERNHPAAIRAEIRRFLVEESDTLELAPMSSHLRASVHRLAKSLKLDSRSKGKEGKGIGRYPVLTKTPHTPYYTIDTVWQVDALMQSRKFFPAHTPKSGKASGTKRGGGVASASFRTGEVVGASAPELGADNKGRAMLEKMGWTSGTGIGADGNKGRLVAIEQVVRRGRSGLG